VLARKSGNIFDPHKHEEEAIYEINQRNPNVCRIAGAAKQRSSGAIRMGITGRSKTKV